MFKAYFYPLCCVGSASKLPNLLLNNILKKYLISCVGVEIMSFNRKFAKETGPGTVRFPLLFAASCNSIESPRNGKVHHNETKHGALVLFSCNYGFKLQGTRQLKCVEGKWNGTSPICKGFKQLKNVHVADKDSYMLLFSPFHPRHLLPNISIAIAVLCVMTGLEMSCHVLS